LWKKFCGIQSSSFLIKARSQIISRKKPTFSTPPPLSQIFQRTKLCIWAVTNSSTLPPSKAVLYNLFWATAHLDGKPWPKPHTTCGSCYFQKNSTAHQCAAAHMLDNTALKCDVICEWPLSSSRGKDVVRRQTDEHQNASFPLLEIHTNNYIIAHIEKISQII